MSSSMQVLRHPLSPLNLIEQIAVAGRQVYDANIVATMQAYGISHLLTHNTADFVRFAAMIDVLGI